MNCMSSRIGRLFLASAAVVLMHAVGIDLASAQQAPAPLPGPANTIDLGDIGIGDAAIRADIPILNDQNIWFKFRLTAGISPKTWLNIDTARSTINTEIGLYDEWSYKLAEDDYGGGGVALNNSTASAITYGGGSGERLGEDGPGWFGSRIDTGYNTVGNIHVWLPTLRVGTYYVCVVGSGADFSQSPNPNWRVSTNFQGSGAIRLRVRTGEVPSTQWNEHHNGDSTGDTPGSALAVEGFGPLTTILCTHATTTRDMFKIRICDPASFSVVATSTHRLGNQHPSMLLLFDAEGRGVLGIDNAVGGDTTLSLPPGFSIPSGDYYLAVSSRCNGVGGFDRYPYDAQGRALWNFANAADRNRPIPPNGTGALNPIHFNGRQSDCGGFAEGLFVRMTLTGACHIEPECRGDFNHDGFVNSQDFFDFVVDFFAGCP